MPNASVSRSDEDWRELFDTLYQQEQEEAAAAAAAAIPASDTCLVSGNGDVDDHETAAVLVGTTIAHTTSHPTTTVERGGDVIPPSVFGQ